MSCTLMWRPVKPGRSIGDHALREAIREEYSSFPVRLSAADGPFFRGLRAAGVEGASAVLDLIEKHDEIELYTEC